MDERLMKKCIGRPIPEWDLRHRLPIDRPVGPDLWDVGTLFRINSTYMDVTEPSLMEKQWFTAGVLLALLFVCVGPYVYWLTNVRYPDAGGFLGNVFAAAISIVFGTITWKLGRGLFFGLTRRPIRFHRQSRKLFAIREKRLFAKPGEGDIVWEAPWSQESIFCLHREVSTFGELFHIRHYKVDEQGNVTQVFSIGREWMPTIEVRSALAQWNYWCKYMNDGPNGLPKPMMFHTENETPRESFLFSLYGFGLNAPAIWRIIVMPLVLVFSATRVLANATCRAPVWPNEIAQISNVGSDDPYAEPRPGTPKGWAETVEAQQRGSWPNGTKSTAEGWTGEPDGKVHARAWLKDSSVQTHSAVLEKQ
jgi:hypothetical protein